MPTAVQRPGGPLQSTEDAAAYFTQQRLRNPSFRAPEGYRWDGTRYVRDNQRLLDDLAKWGSRSAVVGSAALGGATLAGVGPLAGSGALAAGPGWTAGVAALPGATVPAGAAGAGTAAAAGGGMNWLTAAQLGLGGYSMLRNRGGDDDGAGPLDNELRQLLQMQSRRMQQSEPLYQAIMQLAQHLMPQGGGTPGLPASQSRTPMPGSGVRRTI